jgi:hypothetical protein
LILGRLIAEGIDLRLEIRLLTCQSVDFDGSPCGVGHSDR